MACNTAPIATREFCQRVNSRMQIASVFVRLSDLCFKTICNNTTAQAADGFFRVRLLTLPLGVERLGGSESDLRNHELRF